MQLGRFIREYRLERGMTQLELARKLKITNVSLNYLENGKRKAGPKIIKSIAKYFDIDVREVVLMNNEDNK